MEDCDCSTVPLQFLTVGSETICPDCKGTVTHLSREEFEQLLRTVYDWQVGEPA
jgi:hypothetical protein